MVKQRGVRKKTRTGAIGKKGGAAKGGAAAGGRPPLFLKLESTDDNEREHGCLAIASLASEGAQEMQELLQHGAVEVLSARLTDSLLRVRLAAVAAIRSMVVAGGGAACSAVVASGTVGPLVAQLAAGPGGAGGGTGAAAAAVSDATTEEASRALTEQLLVQVLVTLTLLCQGCAEAVEALTERPVLDACIAFLQPAAAAAAAGSAPRTPLIEMVTLLHTLVEDNPMAVEYMAPAPAAAPALTLVAVGQLDGAPPLLRALCAATVLSLVQQQPAAAAALAEAAGGWGWPTLTELATFDSLAATSTALAASPADAGGVSSETRAQTRAQLKSLEALTDALFEEGGVPASAAQGSALLEALLPRCTAVPDAAATDAAAAAIASAGEAAAAAGAGASAAAGAGEGGSVLLQGGSHGYDDAGTVLSELWTLVCAVPAHACRCAANLLASEAWLDSAYVAGLPRPAVWETLLAGWVAAAQASAAAAPAAAAAAAAGEQRSGASVHLAACTGVLVALLRRDAALAATVAQREPELSALLAAASSSDGPARGHGLSLLSLVGCHLNDGEALVATGTAALTSIVDSRWPTATLLAALELIIEVFGPLPAAFHLCTNLHKPENGFGFGLQGASSLR